MLPSIVLTLLRFLLVFFVQALANTQVRLEGVTFLKIFFISGQTERTVYTVLAELSKVTATTLISEAIEAPNKARFY